MPIVSAGPNEYLLTGGGGRLRNRGSAIHAFLRPGTVYVLVPGAKQEATFEFTQETRDGIPLRFKGILIYRIVDPVAAASLFDFRAGGAASVPGTGVDRITALLTHVCLGELRDAVSHMTMAECIEGRKSTLTGVAEAAVRNAARGDGDPGWGIGIEVAQVAQVFIVDAELRRQLEAEVRNEIRLASDRSDLRTQEESRLSQMTSEGRLAEQKLAGDREALRRQEELELAQLARERRMEAEKLASEQQALELEQERTRARMAAEQDRLETETPVRLLRIERERDVLAEELGMRRLQNEVRALDVEHELSLARAEQALRREILPLEQAPRIVEAASRVLQGTNLSIYGEDGRLAGQLAPVLEVLGRAVQRAVGQEGPAAEGAAAGEPSVAVDVAGA